MHEPNLNPPRHRRARVPLASRDDSRWTAHAVVGIAHLVLGVIGVIGLVLFLAQVVAVENGVVGYSVGFESLPSVIASLLLPFGGLWLADGRKIGARMVIAADTIFAGLLVLNGEILTLNMMIYVGLGLAALNILPGLELDRRGE